MTTPSYFETLLNIVPILEGKSDTVNVEPPDMSIYDNLRTISPILPREIPEELKNLSGLGFLLSQQMLWGQGPASKMSTDLVASFGQSIYEVVEEMAIRANLERNR